MAELLDVRPDPGSSNSWNPGAWFAGSWNPRDWFGRWGGKGLPATGGEKTATENVEEKEEKTAAEVVDGKTPAENLEEKTRSDDRDRDPDAIEPVPVPEVPEVGEDNVAGRVGRDILNRFGDTDRLLADGSYDAAFEQIEKRVRERRATVDADALEILRGRRALRPEFVDPSYVPSAKRLGGREPLTTEAGIHAASAELTYGPDDPEFAAALELARRVVGETNLTGDREVAEVIARLVAHEHVTMRWRGERLERYATELGFVLGTVDPGWALSPRRPENRPGLRGGGPGDSGGGQRPAGAGSFSRRAPAVLRPLDLSPGGLKSLADELDGLLISSSDLRNATSKLGGVTLGAARKGLLPAAFNEASAIPVSTVAVHIEAGTREAVEAIKGTRELAGLVHNGVSRIPMAGWLAVLAHVTGASGNVAGTPVGPVEALTFESLEEVARKLGDATGVKRWALPSTGEVPDETEREATAGHLVKAKHAVLMAFEGNLVSEGARGLLDELPWGRREAVETFVAHVLALNPFALRVMAKTEAFHDAASWGDTDGWTDGTSPGSRRGVAAALLDLVAKLIPQPGSESPKVAQARDDLLPAELRAAVRAMDRDEPRFWGPALTARSGALTRLRSDLAAAKQEVVSAYNKLSREDRQDLLGRDQVVQGAINRFVAEALMSGSMAQKLALQTPQLKHFVVTRDANSLLRAVASGGMDRSLLAAAAKELGAAPGVAESSVASGVVIDSGSGRGGSGVGTGVSGRLAAPEDVRPSESRAAVLSSLMGAFDRYQARLRLASSAGGQRPAGAGSGRGGSGAVPRVSSRLAAPADVPPSESRPAWVNTYLVALEKYQERLRLGSSAGGSGGGQRPAEAGSGHERSDQRKREAVEPPEKRQRVEGPGAGSDAGFGGLMWTRDGLADVVSRLDAAEGRGVAADVESAMGKVAEAYAELPAAVREVLHGLGVREGVDQFVGYVQAGRPFALRVVEQTPELRGVGGTAVELLTAIAGGFERMAWRAVVG
ncbi:hypothetical protein, partial [Saccharopolyspora elongata]|uniref:hypothetical protein n=1 Tax=Saccharopolyspora elongata TaxID=2530387 RepID=UPI001A9F7BF1